MVDWMQHQIFWPLFFLQLLNLFWYYLMIKILIKFDNFFFHTYLSLTSISGLYARLILMTLDRMTKVKTKMINKIEPGCNPPPPNDLVSNILYTGQE